MSITNGNGKSDQPRADVIQSLTVVTSDPTTIHRIGRAMGELAAKLWAESEQKITSLSISYNITEDEEVEEELVNLEEAMAEMATNMVETRNDLRRLYELVSANGVETRNDIRRLYEAWPDQIRAIAQAAENVRRRSTETDASMVNELQNIYRRLDSIERILKQQQS